MKVYGEVYEQKENQIKRWLCGKQEHNNPAGANLVQLSLVQETSFRSGIRGRGTTATVMLNRWLIYKRLGYMHRGEAEYMAYSLETGWQPPRPGWKYKIEGKPGGQLRWRGWIYGLFIRCRGTTAAYRLKIGPHLTRPVVREDKRVNTHEGRLSGQWFKFIATTQIDVWYQ